MKTKSLSVLLPTYNERNNIIPLIRKIKAFVHPDEIIVIDDNSTDETGSVVSYYCRTHRDVILIENNPRLGLTQSLQKGIDEAVGTYIAWMDADFSHPPDLLPIMFTAIKNADIVVGSWHIAYGCDKRTEKLHRLISAFVNYLCRILFSSSVHTYTSGYILTKKSVLEEQPLRGDYGEYCIDFLVRNQRRKKIITEIPFTCISRVKGQTKTCPDMKTYFVHGLRYLRMMTTLLVNNGQRKPTATRRVK